MKKSVILVNEQDGVTGSMEKMEAHEKGLLHRAFSIFVFNSKGEMLLQQRAADKYHSGGLWTNACCSHPQPGDDTLLSAQKRLKEEMGFETSIQKIFDFVYQATFENGLTEYEFDHVFVGEYDGVVEFNKEEVMNYHFMSVPQIRDLLRTRPQQYTAWFHLAFPKIEEWWVERYNKRVA